MFNQQFDAKRNPGVLDHSTRSTLTLWEDAVVKRVSTDKALRVAGLRTLLHFQNLALAKETQATHHFQNTHWWSEDMLQWAIRHPVPRTDTLEHIPIFVSSTKSIAETYLTAAQCGSREEQEKILVYMDNCRRKDRKMWPAVAPQSWHSAVPVDG